MSHHFIPWLLGCELQYRNTNNARKGTGTAVNHQHFNQMNLKVTWLHSTVHPVHQVESCSEELCKREGFSGQKCEKIRKG